MYLILGSNVFDRSGFPLSFSYEDPVRTLHVGLNVFDKSSCSLYLGFSLCHICSSLFSVFDFMLECV
jgi:hypothetical protein